MEMAKTKLIVLLLCIGALSGYAQSYEWSCAEIDGSMTGCVSPDHENLPATLGLFLDNGDFRAPNGKVFKAGTATAKVAAAVAAAQPKMQRVKTVIGYSEDEMIASKMHETPLSNWFVGIVMDKVAELSGKKIDVGICNHGGIRVNMPKGNVILDDILSMFPFKNNVVYLEHKGSELRKLFETMAATYFQAIGGVEIVAEGGKLQKVLIGGEPLDDNKTYSVATISFLLYGGDSLTLAKNAENLKQYDVQIVAAVLEHIEDLKAQGKNIVAPEVTHVIIK
jgi:2',3'-cyclic-nucleotide 2'-phosphodiesterase (5'-nucleotidase family)